MSVMLATLLLLLALAQRPGVTPDTPWSCPATHPVKGYLSESGRRIYYLPGSTWYAEASPERCYASEAEALRDGSQPWRSPAPARRTDDLVDLIREAPRPARGSWTAQSAPIARAISTRSPSG